MPLISKPATGPFTSTERTIITVPVLAASLLHSINMSSAYVALPQMQGNLSATPDQIGWVITAFVVATAVGTILTGWFSQRFGRKVVFLGAIAGFTLTSLLCAFATGLEDLVAYRAMQGFVSAPLLPVAQSIMLDTYPRERHGFAMSIWSMGMIIGPVVAPTLGAFLTDEFGWRYLFYMNIPMGVLAFAGILVTLPSAKSQTQPMDWLGVVTLIVGVSCLQLVLDRGERLGWMGSTEIVVEAALAGLCLYVFVVHCLTARRPYLNLTMFRDRNYVIGLMLIFVFGVAVFASLFILPLFMQNVQGYPVMTAGWIVSARGIGTMIAMLSGGFLADRISGKYLILTGLVAVCASNAWMTTWTASVPMEQIVYLTLVNGFGMGIMWVSLATVTFSTLESTLRVEAASLFALVRSIGASMGTSAIVMTLTRSAQTSYVELRDHVTPYSEAIRAMGSGLPWDMDTVAGLSALRGLVINEARMVAFLNDFTLLVIVVIIPMPLVFFLKKPAGR
ncbi:MAG: DHA2 family efflux MFS transporter permease subunit [Alphaproteobacteria bacterium]|nr:DHA2 family efflux MFS transporter permease subunit [Alphaproteobacteria bacterium]MCB9931234.1 DHA2 family efflux MFS transporter permease subunit [Alphaproteobacteria bacterium]